MVSSTISIRSFTVAALLAYGLFEAVWKFLECSGHGRVAEWDGKLTGYQGAPPHREPNGAATARERVVEV
jgi:hypothetical protein